MAAMLTVADARQDFAIRKLERDMILSPGFFFLVAEQAPKWHLFPPSMSKTRQKFG
jgi:hypothetical protein